MATFAEAGLPTEPARTLPYRAGMTSEQAVAFHRRGNPGTRRDHLPRSVHEELRGEIARAAPGPSVHSVRVALRQLLLSAEGQAQEDAQIALGLIEMDAEEGLLREATALGGTLAAFRGGTHLLVTTRGPLHDATGGFTSLPMLRRLAGHTRWSASASGWAAAPPRRRAWLAGRWPAPAGSATSPRSCRCAPTPTSCWTR